MGGASKMGMSMIVLGSVAAALLGYAPRVRRIRLRRTLGAYPAAFLRNGAWESGVMHFTDDALLWYREDSISPLPVVCVPRHLLTMRRLEEQEQQFRQFRASGVGRAHPHWIMIELESERGASGLSVGRTPTALTGVLSVIRACPEPAEQCVFALGYEQSAGITSWIEAWGSVGRGQWR